MTNEIMRLIIPSIGVVVILMCVGGIGIIIKDSESTFIEKTLAFILGLLIIILIECLRLY